jgi:two-component system, NarL family, invasion response regulator UvrY
MRKILLVDDHEVVRDGVKKLFDDQPDPIVFGEASTIAEALKLVAEQAWDGAVIDLSLRGRDGLELLKELKQMRPRLPVLVLSMHSEAQYARRAFKAGADGYVTKDSPGAELVKAIYKVLKGEKYVSPALAEKLVIELGRSAEGPPHETLSDREYQVFYLIASGKTVGEIAEMLSLSDKTISTYRARILEKMGLKTNAELTHYAFQNKLIS